MGAPRSPKARSGGPECGWRLGETLVFAKLQGSRQKHQICSFCSFAGARSLPRAPERHLQGSPPRFDFRLGGTPAWTDLQKQAWRPHETLTSKKYEKRGGREKKTENLQRRVERGTRNGKNNIGKEALRKVLIFMCLLGCPGMLKTCIFHWEY